MPAVTRRTLLAGTAVAAIAAGADPAAAAAPPADKQAPAIYRYKIGSYELTALYDGIWYRPITDKFIRNAPFADVEHALDAAFMPHDKLATPFTALVVNTGSKLVLIDTGTGGQISAIGRRAARQPHRRRDRSERGRRDRHLAFSSRPHQRHQGQGQQADLSQCRDHGAGAGMGVLDGRCQPECRAGGSEADLPQSAAHLCRYRQAGDAL